MMMVDELIKIKENIYKWQGKEVDIIYHPHSTYRMIKQGNAKIGALYDHFFEVEIDTKEYGIYKTTITYLDVYTQSCHIQEHKENQPES